MRCLFTSDMHGNLSDLDLAGIDLAVFAGDIAPLKGFGMWHVHDQLKWMNTKFKTFCEKYSSTKIVFIPGNHDWFALARQRFGADWRWNLELVSNCTMLIDKMTEVNGLKIYGTPWVPVISHCWAFEAEHDKLAERFSHIPKSVDILVTHSPPHISSDCMIDRSIQYYMSEPFGSNELASAIFEKKPRFEICGHIHSGSHDESILGNTTCYNVSRVNEDYEIVYEPLILDI